MRYSIGEAVNNMIAEGKLSFTKTAYKKRFYEKNCTTNELFYL